MHWAIRSNFCLPKQPQKARSNLKMDIDFSGCFGRKKLCNIINTIFAISKKGVNI